MYQFDLVLDISFSGWKFYGKALMQIGPVYMSVVNNSKYQNQITKFA